MTLLLFLFWYMVGGILPALYIGKSKGIDVRETGSGNLGARNAGRALGKSAFVARYGEGCVTSARFSFIWNESD